jgi:hypothetical protein
MAAFEAEAAAMLDSLQARAEQTLATIQAGAEQTLASLRAAAEQARPAAGPPPLAADQRPAPPRQRARELPPAAEPLPGPSEGVWEVCEIDCWRGYLKSEFYATASTPDGADYAAGRSPAFRWRGSGPPEPTEAVAAAHEALVARLEREGWERYERGSLWYSQRLRRPSGGRRT